MTQTRANPKKRQASVARPAAKATSLDRWQDQTLAEVRRVILQTNPDIVEERKWMKPSNPAGVPVWSHAGIICTGETYKEVVKLTFARGASLDDPHRLFNASLDGNTRRAIDIRQGQTVQPAALQALVRAAIAENLRQAAGKSKSPAKKAAAAPASTNEAGTVRLLSGGNPQIAKGDGDAPVQAYIAAMPGWKSDFGKRLDGLIAQHVPNVRKAVKWNSPFYGIEGQGWFLSFHVFTKYVKVTFFAGTSLQPIPPGGTPKSKECRWIDVYESDGFDEDRMATWIRQAASVPGWIP